MTTVTQQAVVHPQLRFANRWDTRLVSSSASVSEVDNHKLLRVDASAGDVTLTFANPEDAYGVHVKGVVVGGGNDLVFAGGAAGDFRVVQVTLDDNQVDTLATLSATTVASVAAGVRFDALSNGVFWTLNLYANDALA